MTEPAKAAAGEALPDRDAAADEAIEVCGGNVRQAVIALLVLNDALERELERTRVAVSNGYSRG